VADALRRARRKMAIAGVLFVLAVMALLLRPFWSSLFRGPGDAPDGAGPWDLFQIGSAAEKYERLAFVNRDVGFAISQDALYRTDDGGQTWREVCRASFGPVHFLHFTDQRSGWLGNGRLQQTRDGGDTWTPVDLPGSAGLQAIHALATGPEGWMLAAGMVGAGEESEFVLFGKGNAGSSWEKLDPEKAGYWGGARAAYRHWRLGGLAILGPRQAVAALFTPDHEGGATLRTTDGGATWQPTNTDPEAGQFCVQAVGPGRVWLAGAQGRLWFSDDAGAHWQPRNNPGGILPATCLAFEPSGGLGLAPLERGKVLLTRDGSSWEAVPAPFETAMPAAVVVAPDRAFVLGANGRMARYRGAPESP